MNSVYWRRLFIGFVFLILIDAASVMAQPSPLDPGSAPTNTPIASWSFYDNTNWTSDQGFSPISSTNLEYSYLGDFASLVVDTNVPAWLNYNIYEPGAGATNLVLDAPGSITFWFAPDWSSTNAGGSGPGEWAQLMDVGEWTTNSSYGYWGLSVDPPGQNLWFVSQDGAGDTYALSTPISWTTNYFHYVALTYSSTNVSIYLDGELATNDSGGLSVWPSSAAVTGGIFFGSDTNGLMQAQGLFNSVETYNYELGSNDVQNLFSWNYGYYMINPWNDAMFVDITSAPSNPSTSPTTPEVITGQGDLISLGAASCLGFNTNVVWISSITSTMTNGTMNVTFSIEGGTNGILYDVFANSVLSFGPTGVPWAWMGQGQTCQKYSLTILPNTDCFLILGTPQDSDSDGLTDAYELLVSKTDPNNKYSNLDGILDGWEILLGLNPTINNFTSSSQRLNYDYTPADWLNTVSGIRSGAVTTDNEGNVQSVSQ